MPRVVDLGHLLAFRGQVAGQAQPVMPGPFHREQLSIPVDQDRLGGFRFGLLAGPLDELSVDESRSGADQGDEVGAFTQRQRSCADSMSLNAIARPEAREPGPLVTLLLCRTVARVDSIGFVVRRCTQCSAG